MDITINKENGRLIVALIGDFDNAASTKAQRNLSPVFECDDSDILIDCTQLEYISSSGLRILLSILKQAKSHDCNLVLKNVNDDIKDVFRMTGFINIFQFE